MENTIMCTKTGAHLPQVAIVAGHAARHAAAFQVRKLALEVVHRRRVHKAGLLLIAHVICQHVWVVLQNFSVYQVPHLRSTLEGLLAFKIQSETAVHATFFPFAGFCSGCCMASFLGGVLRNCFCYHKSRLVTAVL